MTLNEARKLYRSNRNIKQLIRNTVTVLVNSSDDTFKQIMDYYKIRVKTDYFYNHDRVLVYDLVKIVMQLTGVTDKQRLIKLVYAMTYSGELKKYKSPDPRLNVTI